MGPGTYRGKPVQQPIAVVVSPEPTKERSLVERIFMPTGDPSLSKNRSDKAVALVDIKPQETPAVAKTKRTTTRPSSVPAQIAPPSIAPIAPPQEDKPWYSSLFSGGTPTKPGEYSGLREVGMGTAQFLGNLGNNLTRNFAGNEALNAGFAQKRLEYADRDPASNSSVLTRGMARALGMPIKGDESAFDLKQQMPYVRDMLAARTMQGRAGGGGGGQAKPAINSKDFANVSTYKNSLNRDLNELHSIIDNYGTVELTGPQSQRKDQLIQQIAVNYNKMLDPTSVVRPDEAKTIAENLGVKGWFTSNDTAKESIKGFQKQINDFAGGKLKDMSSASEDAQALQFAQDNPDDPRSKQILQGLGIK